MARDGYVISADPQASLKKKTAVSRSWILLDCTGEDTFLDVDKYAIMNRVQIHARDLRILDPLLSYPSTIFGREQAIVLNLEHIKAIITAEEISSRKLGRVRKLKSTMTSLNARVQKVRDELEQLLNDDDDMANLYLSRKLAGPSSPVSGSGVSDWFPASPTIGLKIYRASRASAVMVHGNENDVEELEMLLEAYFIEIDGTLNKLTTLCDYIDNTEDYINIKLDNHRNRLIQANLYLSSTILCLSICSLVAGYFGMSVPYGWNYNHGYLFKWVLIITGATSATIFILIIFYARHKGLIGS